MCDKLAVLTSQVSELAFDLVFDSVAMNLEVGDWNLKFRDKNCGQEMSSVSKFRVNGQILRVTAKLSSVDRAKLEMERYWKSEFESNRDALPVRDHDIIMHSIPTNSSYTSTANSALLLGLIPVRLETFPALCA